MFQIDIDDLKVYTYQRGYALGYDCYQFILVEKNEKKFGMYREGDGEWKGFRGILLDEEKTHLRGSIFHKIVDLKMDDSISEILGGGKWLRQPGRGSFVHVETFTPEDTISEINKFISSEYLPLVKRNYNNFYYFSQNNIKCIKLDIFELVARKIKNEVSCKKYLQNRNIALFRTLIEKEKRIEELEYERTFLVFYLAENNLQMLEVILEKDPYITLKLDYYETKENKNLLLRYKIIYFYFEDDFKFEYFLIRNVKNLKKLSLGKNRGNEMNLIDMLLGRDIEFVMEVVKSNKKLFLTQEAKKLVKEKKNMTNHHICTYLIRLK